MALILADTSAWVENDRTTGSRVDLRMLELLDGTAPDDVLATTEPVQMELLAGARTDRREEDLRRMLAGVHWIPADASADFDAGARAYRLCRRGGITPRGLVDCMIVAIAHRTQATVLAHDVDVARIADVLGVRLDPASLRA